MNTLDAVPAIRKLLEVHLQVEAAQSNFANAEKELLDAKNAEAVAQKAASEAVDANIDTLILGSCMGMQIMRLTRQNGGPISLKRVPAVRV